MGQLTVLGSRRSDKMPPLGEFSRDLARGGVNMVVRMVGGAMALLILAVGMAFGAEYIAHERVKEQEAHLTAQQERKGNYSAPPSSLDGWGDETLN